MRRCTPCPCWILLQPCWVNRLVGIPYSSTVWGTVTILLFELCSHSSRFDHSVCINHTVFASFVRAWGREGGREGCFHWGHICICLNECRFFMFLMHFRAKFDRDYISALPHHGTVECLRNFWLYKLSIQLEYDWLWAMGIVHTACLIKYHSYILLWLSVIWWGSAASCVPRLMAKNIQNGVHRSGYRQESVKDSQWRNLTKMRVAIQTKWSIY